MDIAPPRLYLYFDAVIRHGSIRGAAEAMRVAASAVSRRILDLEAELGAALFDRSQKGVQLTPAGEIFAAHVRRVLADVRQTSEALRELQGPMRGHVIVASAESAAIELLPGIMVQFQQQFPHVRFSVAVGTPAALLEDLLDDRADLILTHEEPRHHDVAVLAQIGKSFCAMMRQDHPLANHPILSIHDCLDYPIVLAEADLAARALVDTALADTAATVRGSGVRTKPVLITNMFEVMKHYVRLTDAVSFQFHFAGSGRAPLDGVIAIPLADRPLASARLFLAARRGRVLSSSAQAVADVLRSDLSGANQD
ncbi:LysR family transcriptional regulator [Acidiphilium sp. PA]|uniref:LysR family transcriptional regulator n=1 Tax=Acidiphilium sp. PA TaxID=2871705 RepID=UPI002242D62F|nr:LysR family transcriptional regulator [Acidiphilium sp. PA]MCW8308357.1 LysR family transcriptional regulator [Acidiphilium sp. PA]